MNVERTNDEVKFVDLGITLSAHDFNEIREYARYLDRVNFIDGYLEYLIDMFISIGGTDNKKRAEYIDAHKEKFYEKLQGNADKYSEEAITEASNYGNYSIPDEIWSAIEDDVDWGAGIKTSSDDEFGE